MTNAGSVVIPPPPAISTNKQSAFNNRICSASRHRIFNSAGPQTSTPKPRARETADQERQVTEVRGRGATLLAAGAVIASLLAKPVFHSGHPRGFGEVAGTVVGLLGCAGVLLFVVLLLRPYRLGFSVKPGVTYRALWDQGILEQPMVDIALAEAFEERREENAKVVKRLVLFLALALASLLLQTIGLATAAALTS